MRKSQTKTVGEDEARNDPNGIVMSDDPECIPDLVDLTNQVISFIDYMDTPEMMELEKKSEAAYSEKLQTKFESFTLKYYNLYKMLLNRKDRVANLEKLEKMINILKDVSAGIRDKNVEQEKFIEQQRQEYIYPGFGGKHKFMEFVEKNSKN